MSRINTMAQQALGAIIQYDMDKAGLEGRVTIKADPEIDCIFIVMIILIPFSESKASARTEFRAKVSPKIQSIRQVWRETAYKYDAAIVVNYEAMPPPVRLVTDD